MSFFDRIQQSLAVNGGTITHSTPANSGWEVFASPARKAVLACIMACQLASAAAADIAPHAPPSDTAAGKIYMSMVHDGLQQANNNMAGEPAIEVIYYRPAVNKEELIAQQNHAKSGMAYASPANASQGKTTCEINPSLANIHLKDRDLVRNIPIDLQVQFVALHEAAHCLNNADITPGAYEAINDVLNNLREVVEANPKIGSSVIELQTAYFEGMSDSYAVIQIAAKHGKAAGKQLLDSLITFRAMESMGDYMYGVKKGTSGFDHDTRSALYTLEEVGLLEKAAELSQQDIIKTAFLLSQKNLQSTLGGRAPKKLFSAMEAHAELIISHMGNRPIKFSYGRENPGRPLTSDEKAVDKEILLDLGSKLPEVKIANMTAGSQARFATSGISSFEGRYLFGHSIQQDEGSPNAAAARAMSVRAILEGGEQKIETKPRTKPIL